MSKQQSNPESEAKLPQDLRMNQPHDTYFKQIFQSISFAIAFLSFALKNTRILDSIDLSKLKVERRSFFDRRVFGESFADMIYSIPLKNKPKQRIKAFVLLEHKSYNDFLAIFQLAYYTMQILFKDFCQYRKQNKRWSEYRLPLVVPIIIHHGKSKFTGATQICNLFPKIPGFSRYLFHFKSILVDLNRIPIEELPNDPNVWQLNIVLKIMKLVFDGDRKTDIEACFRQIWPYLEDNPEHREFALLTIRYFMHASDVEENWFENMVMDSYPEEDEGADRGMPTIAEQIFARGRKEGRKEGREEGREEGIERGRYGQIQSILEILRARFGRVPASVSQRVKQMTDFVALQSLTVAAATCSTIKEFQENL